MFHPTVSQIIRVFWLVKRHYVAMTRGINHAHYKTNKICAELEKSLMATCYDVGFIAE
jgi:hypothetical protein